MSEPGLVQEVRAALERRRLALEGILQFFLRPGENPIQRLDRLTEAFYRATHMLPPGASVPLEASCLHDDEARRAAYDAWVSGFVQRARDVLAEGP